jgi:hypothetical protein
MDGLSVEIVASQIVPVKFQKSVTVNKETEIQHCTKPCTEFRLISRLTAMR